MTINELKKIVEECRKNNTLITDVKIAEFLIDYCMVYSYDDRLELIHPETFKEAVINLLKERT